MLYVLDMVGTGGSHGQIFKITKLQGQKFRAFLRGWQQAHPLQFKTGIKRIQFLSGNPYVPSAKRPVNDLFIGRKPNPRLIITVFLFVQVFHRLSL
ncbi:MAG: hypothetical protein AB7E95_10140 [Kiritimatiellales bacterium]